jgi:hypothetical protein
MPHGSLLPYAEEHFEGDQPSQAESDLETEVDYVCFGFRKVAQPGVFVAFELRNAVSAFVGRKSKQQITVEDATQLKDAVGVALRAALHHSDTRGMRYLRRGMAAICEAIDAWAKPPIGKDQTAYVRNAYIGVLKHETAIADMVSVVAEYSPATWVRRHEGALA